MLHVVVVVSESFVICDVVLCVVVVRDVVLCVVVVRDVACGGGRCCGEGERSGDSDAAMT